MIAGLGNLVRPFLMALEAERAHALAVAGLKLVPCGAPPADDPALAVTCLGRRFPNPIGLAAGFDKHGEVPDAALALGFGFVEIGGVTPRPQPGNPRPRVFRLPADGAVINRYGFNSEGAERVAARLAARAARPGIVGVNLGANKDSIDKAADFALLAGRFAPLADFLTVNVSSPNTPGLRSLQEAAALDDLLARAIEARDVACRDQRRRTPLLVKIAPDLAEADLDAIVAVACRQGVDGMIVSNTTVARPETLFDRATAKEAGGLSGRPLFAPSTRMLAMTFLRVAGQFPLIGVGGVDSADTALAKIEAGATLVQLYTAMVYEGPGLVDTIKKDLAARLAADGPPLAARVGSRAEAWARGRRT